MTGEVYYFEDDQIRATNVATFANRLVARLPAGRMPIGQAAFSPDGRWFAYIHADAALYRALLTEREIRTAARHVLTGTAITTRLPQRHPDDAGRGRDRNRARSAT